LGVPTRHMTDDIELPRRPVVASGAAVERHCCPRTCICPAGGSAASFFWSAAGCNFFSQPAS
jgi:hypothetical protein